MPASVALPSSVEPRAARVASCSESREAWSAPCLFAPRSEVLTCATRTFSCQGPAPLQTGTGPGWRLRRPESNDHRVFHGRVRVGCGGLPGHQLGARVPPRAGRRASRAVRGAAGHGGCPGRRRARDHGLGDRPRPSPAWHRGRRDDRLERVQSGGPARPGGRGGRSDQAPSKGRRPRRNRGVGDRQGLSPRRGRSHRRRDGTRPGARGARSLRRPVGRTSFGGRTAGSAGTVVRVARRGRRRGGR